jgi:zona occludens toxin (predicted ATPase)
MTIKYYCGPPGSGKSYHVVKEVIIPALKERRKILTNLPVKLEVMAAKIPELKFVEKMNFLEMIDEEKIRNIHELVDDEDGTYAGYLIVIDEAHNYWPTNEPIKDKGFRKWYTKHRHNFQDVVLVTQDHENVNKFMRSLMDCRFQYSKNEDLGLSNGYNEDYYSGKSKKQPVRTMFSYDKFYFQFYFSHSQSLSGRGHVEKRVGKKINILLKPLIIFAVCGFIVFVALFRLFSSYNEKIEAGKDFDPSDTVKVASSNKNVSVSRSGAGQIKGVRASSTFDLEVNGATHNSNDDWCKNVMKINVGVGSNNVSQSRTKLAGHIVVGVIGVGSKSLYLFKTLEGELIKKRLDGSSYVLGEKVCL